MSDNQTLFLNVRNFVISSSPHLNWSQISNFPTDNKGGI